MRGAMQMERRITASAGGAVAEITNSFIARRGVRGIISEMIPLMKSLVWMLALASLVSTVSASDVSDVLSEAQRAYLRNDYAAAKEKFEMVRKVDPTNRTAIAYLRLIAVEEQKSGGKVTRNDTEEACRKLIMEKVDLREASLAEALDFLKQKAATLSGGKVVVNFVLQVDEQTQAKKVTLSVQKVPFSEVLRYVGDLAEVQFKFEQYAIVVKPKGAARPAPAVPLEPPGTVKIPGLN